MSETDAPPALTRGKNSGAKNRAIIYAYLRNLAEGDRPQLGVGIAIDVLPNVVIRLLAVTTLLVGLTRRKGGFLHVHNSPKG